LNLLHFRKRYYDASELLELNRCGNMDDRSAAELDQFEQVELLMRQVKAAIRTAEGANQS